MRKRVSSRTPRHDGRRAGSTPAHVTNQLNLYQMKSILFVMVAILIVSLTLMCLSIIDGDLVTFAFSTGVSIVAVLGATISTSNLDSF